MGGLNPQISPLATPLYRITVSEIQRDICEKIGNFSYTLVFDALVRGVPVGISASPLVWEI